MSTHLGDGGVLPDHFEMQRQGYADLYLAGRLNADQAATFEEHFFDCEECADELENARQFRRALESLPSAVVMPDAAPARFERGWFFAALGFAAAALVLIAPGLILLSRYRAAVKESARVGGELAKEKDQRRSELAALASPRVRRLEQYRSGHPEVPILLASEFNILQIAEPTAVGQWRGSLAKTGGEVVWQYDGLRQDGDGTLTIAVPPNSATPGEFTLRIETMDPAAGLSGRFSIRFQ